MSSLDEALILHQTIVGMRKPSRSTLNFLRDWMRRPTMGNILLTGRDSNIWSDSDRKDLVCLDTSDSYATQALARLYHYLLGRHIHVSTRFISTDTASDLSVNFG
jgi:hypothetical protein